MQLILELTDYHLLKTFNNHKEILYNSSYKNELKYLEANKHHKNRGNNIGNSGPKNRSNNMGSNGTDNNINMDNKISQNINKNRLRNIIWFKPSLLQTL